MVFVEPFLKLLSNQDNITVHGICSDSGQDVLLHEADKRPEDLPVIQRWFKIGDFSAPPSSGSSGYEAMIILPCTMGTLGAIASGLSQNLIHRSADVMLKERKKLILAVRETPLNRNHLQNMLTVHDAGGMIFPPIPGYYLKPKNLDEAALTFGWRLADHLGIHVTERKRWAG